jgi:hypothetical protein
MSNGRNARLPPIKFKSSDDPTAAPADLFDPYKQKGAEYEEIKHLEYLLKPIKPRLSWEEYKEKHKKQFEDRLGTGIQKEQADYRRMLDDERKLKVWEILRF